MKILAINPGSTSTKIAVFEDYEQAFTKTLRHSAEEIGKYPNIVSQFEFRKKMIVEALKENDIALNEIAAIVGRGGLLRPIPSGVYEVNERMLEDLRSGQYGEHASNLGGILAHAIAEEIGCRAFITDPVVVDELCDLARVAGHPLFKRVSVFHALNQKAIAKMYAAQQSVKYEDLNLIVVHLGGGTSVSAHCKGRVIDTNNALNGDGPFSPERSGGLPAQQLADICFSGKYTQAQIEKMIAGQGGLAAHLGTNDMRLIEQWVNEGNEKAKFLVDAMIYHVAKDIASKGAVLCGKVDAILFTGGIAHWKYVVDELCRRVDYLAPTYRYPGEDELEALSFNALSVLRGEREAKEYV